ncbi:MAG: transaldolase family protein [Treponema sp.]|jgi:transaldolase|nr:transaldolase family protein [Treponema sp.]
MHTTYLSWMAAETNTRWNNDSAIDAQAEAAMAQGAIGLTINPPLSYEALTTDGSFYEGRLARIDRDLPDDEYAFQALCLVAARFSKKFMPLHQARGGIYGCVRAQVAPNLRADAKGMLDYGERLAAIGGNIMVKIPGSAAGIWALEELAARGIPTNPTVVVTVSQAVAAAEAFERGRERALKAGMPEPWSSCAVVMGRLQDYLSALNQERNLGLPAEDLERAVLAVVKRVYRIFKERGYRSWVMPAAFRTPLQVEQLAGGEFCETIHPKIQEALAEADKAGRLRRQVFADAPVDEDALKRVSAKIPEFAPAYEPQGLKAEQFDRYGALVMTLDGFDQGWRKLAGLKKR